MFSPQDNLPADYQDGIDYGSCGIEPSFSGRQFIEKYPTAHSIFVATTRLSPGDPARGGKALDLREQEDYVLAAILRHRQMLAVPTRVRQGGVDMFVSACPYPSRHADEVDARFYVVVFREGDPNELTYLAFHTKKPRSPETALADFAQVAVDLLNCVEPIEAESSDGAPEQ